MCHFGKNPPWSVRKDVNLPLELCMKTLCHVVGERLSRAICGHPREGQRRPKWTRHQDGRFDILILESLNQLWYDNLRSVDNMIGIDLHHVLDFTVVQVVERTVKASSSVEHNYANIQVANLGFNGLLILFNGMQFGKVGNHGKSFEWMITVSAFFSNFLKFFVYFLFRSWYYANVESFSSKLLADCKANAVGTTCDNGPCVFSRKILYTVLCIYPTWSLETRSNHLPPKCCQKSPKPLEDLEETNDNGNVHDDIT